MILENQMVKVNWSNRNKTYYINLGYNGFKNGETFDVIIEHLPLNSPSIVEVICDYCGEHHFNEYRRKSKNKNHFCSRECQDSFLIGKPSWNARKVMVNCGYCNDEVERSEWELISHKNLFCGRECADNFLRESGEGRPKVERFKLNCTQCDIEIERTEVEIKRADKHFCTKECADDYMKGKVNLNTRNGHDVNCYNCDKKFYLPKGRIESQERYFCTDECRLIWMKSEEFSNIMKKESTLVKLNCKVCDKELTRKPAEVKTSTTGNFYCCVECKNEDIINWKLPQSKKGEKIKVKCYSCGQDKCVHPSVYNKNKYFFCSFECYHHKRLEITEGKLTATSIHLKTNEMLNDLGIGHENEHPFSCYSTDIYLPKNHLAIEVSGDYWHSSPIVYNYDRLNDTQIKGVRKDYIKHQTLTKRYKLKLLYLWETDINKNQSLCKKLIEKFIDNNGHLEDYNSFNYGLFDGELHLKEKITEPYFMIFNNQVV